MTINDYFRILIQHWWIIFLCTITAVALSFLYIYYAPPQYEASCKLLIVDVNKGGALLDQTDMILGVLGKSDPLMTQVEMIRTRPIFEEVIKRCNLTNIDGTAVKPEAFEKRLTVSAVRLSNIINMSYVNRDPDMAAKVVNTVAEVAGEQNQELNREDIRNMRVFIEQQLESQKTRLENIEQASVNFKKREKTVSIDLQTKSQIESAAEIESAIMKLEGERQGVLAQKGQIEASLAAPRAQADPFYASRLNSLEQIRSKLSSIEAQKASLARQLGGINYRLSSRPQEEVNLTRFMRDEKIAEGIYTSLLSKLQELEIREAAKTASIKLVEPAVSPEEPISPNKKKVIMLAFLCGFFFGYGIAFMTAFFKDSPYSIEAIKNLLPYGILGTVPRAPKKELVLFRSSAHSSAAELVRHIHTNLEFKGIYQSHHLNLLLTSAAQGEGKSVICANLVYPFAETGRRTVLVNLDLRRSVFREMFTLQGTNGVTDFLAGNADFADIVSHQQGGNGIEFDIIEAGKTVQTPARLFLRGKLDQFFTQLGSNYDVCIFYSAPILSASETLDLSRYMNGIVLIADMTISNNKSIAAMQELLENKGLPILGTIVNRTNAHV